jgi:aquaporin Z
MNEPLLRRLFSEFLGTYAMVFACAGAVVVDGVSGGTITHLGMALTSGLAVMVLIYTFGDISGAHMNPAVTIGFTAAGRFPFRELLPYIGAQLVASLAAAGTLRLLFPKALDLGMTLPSGSALQAFVMELIISTLLMVVALNVSHGAKEKGITAGIAVGATVALGNIFAGPVCGSSMNPARSLGPALVSGHPERLWIYMTAPILGALLAIPLFILLRGGKKMDGTFVRSLATCFAD